MTLSDHRSGFFRCGFNSAHRLMGGRASAIRLGMDSERDREERNETDNAAKRIRERVQILHKKTSELNRTLDSVEETLEETKADSKP
jgi:uncharacterized protein YlxW (UPF0749 family)